VPSRRMRSIARRITELEEALLPQSETEDGRSRRGRRSRSLLTHRLEVRYGYIRRLPKDYQGERHVEIAKYLPDQDGEKWVEFEEVPGPAPIEPPEDPRFPKSLEVVHTLDVILVGPGCDLD
jgi:hypothetical protein